MWLWIFYRFKVDGKAFLVRASGPVRRVVRARRDAARPRPHAGDPSLCRAPRTMPRVAPRPPQGIEGLPLSDAIKARIKGLDVDRMTEPLQSRDFTIWYSVLAIETPASRSIYDRDVQLALYAQLRDVRRSIEQQRYIGTLRSRWVTDDIGEMEERLVAFALERYWR